MSPTVRHIPGVGQVWRRRSRNRDYAEESRDFVRDRETGTGTFLERWQREFRQSRHPLSHVLHRMVKLEALEQRSAARDYLYSRSTFKLIHDAKAISNTKTVEPPHGPVVRLSDVVTTLLLQVDGSDGTARSGADHEIERRLASTLSALSNTTALNKARTDRERRASAKPSDAEEWILDEDLVDTCALAAYLVERTRGNSERGVDLDDFVIALLLNPAGQRFIFDTLELAVSSPPLTIGDILQEVVADRSSSDPRILGRRPAGDRQGSTANRQPSCSCDTPARLRCRPPDREAARGPARLSR